MTANFIFILIIIFLTVEFLFERVLDYLNTKNWSDEMPKEVEGIYDEQKYNKSQQYNKARHRFSSVVSIIFFIALLVMLFFHLFAWLDLQLRAITENKILLTLLFFGVLGIANDLLGIPFAAWSTFVIEEKFGFNRTKVKVFIFDRLKSWLVSGLIGGSILTLITVLYLKMGSAFWIPAWIAIILFSIFVTMFYSSLFVPLFNKQTPLEEGELRDAIKEFAAKTDFRITDIYVIDGSKRSNRANAYFSGLGAQKRIVLYDTLIKEHSTEELIAILAHEIGHLKHKHILKSLILSALETGLLLFLFSLILDFPQLSEAFGAQKHSFHFSLLAFGILYSPISTIIGILMNTISRYNEFEADRYAGENYNSKHLMNALIKLSVNHLNNLKPHTAYVFVHFSHPTLLQRLEALRSLNVHK